LKSRPEHSYRIDQSVVARVEQIYPFGVFARLPDGTKAYVRKRELTLSGNLDPQQVVADGDEFQAVVVALAKPGQSLELSVRRAEPDPWEKVAQKLQVRDTVTAEVKRLSAKGVLVQVKPGVDGFVPLSELAPWTVENPHDLLWVGDQVEAMITRLDTKTKRMRLSIRRQMKLQARVREVLDFLSEKQVREEESSPATGHTAVAEDGMSALDETDEALEAEVRERVGRVLVVDDHDEVRKPLVAWLRHLGISAEGAKSPAEALACARVSDHGLAIVDLDLSGEDGLDLIQALARLTPHIRVAVMSSPEWIAQCIQQLASLGVIDVFVKPLDLEDIRDALIKLGHGETDLAWLSTFKPSGEKVESPFQRLGETMRSGISLAARFEAGLMELVRMARAEVGLVFHLDPISQQVSIVAQVGEPAPDPEAIYALTESPVKDVIRERCTVFETHVSRQAQSRFSNLSALVPFESCVGAPVLASDTVQYAVFLFHRATDAFSHHRVRDAQAMAVLFSVAVESQAIEGRLRAVNPFLLSGQLAAGFGHEVYNKMSGLEIQLRNLQADCGRLKQGEEIFDVDALGRTTDQLLDVALDLKRAVTLFRELIRAEQEETVDVHAVLQRAVLLLRPIARRHRVRIEMEPAAGLPPVSTSAVRLQQVFVNLMLNAVQHTEIKMRRWPEGRGILQITTAWEQEGTRPVRVRFADNGPGIHRQLWEKIFALGFSTRPQGTGLGLFIARSLVESMDGKICVEQSPVPSGATLRVELPAARTQM